MPSGVSLETEKPQSANDKRKLWFLSWSINQSQSSIGGIVEKYWKKIRREEKSNWKKQKQNIVNKLGNKILQTRIWVNVIFSF